MSIEGKNLTVTLHGKVLCCVPFKRSEIDVTNDDCDGWKQQKDPSAAAFMRLFLDMIKAGFPSWARWACVLPDDRLWLFSERPELTCFGAQCDGESMQFGIAQDPMFSPWQETLTELATIKPDLPVETVRNDRIGDNSEMIDRDKRDTESQQEFECRARQSADYRALTQPVRDLTIPPGCLRDQAMPMMLGGGFGGEV